MLEIKHLGGALLPTEDAPPWFDDPESFRLAIDTGEVAITPTSLSALLNDYVFNYRGRILRFGKLTMEDADLQIVDRDPKDPFDFYLAHLNEQLVAGESRNQADFALLTVMPDYADLEKRSSAGAKAR